MNEHQFARVLRNRRPPGVRRLFQDARIGAMLRKAARDAHACAAAQAAWEKVAPPQHLAVSQVESVQDHVAVIAVSNPAYLFDLRRTAARLARQMAAHVPALGALRFVALGDPPGSARGADGGCE